MSIWTTGRDMSMERFSTYWETVKDRYFTWRTGRSKTEREWHAWYKITIVQAAHTVENYFMNFKYIIEVDPNRVWNQYEPFGWVPVEDFKQYEFPQRALGNNAVISWFRGYRDQWDSRFHINEMAGYDCTFVATNNEQDAIMIALKYA